MENKTLLYKTIKIIIIIKTQQQEVSTPGCFLWSRPILYMFNSCILFQPAEYVTQFTTDEHGKGIRIKFAHGTTTLGFRYQGGVVLAVDSRATGGQFIGWYPYPKLLCFDYSVKFLCTESLQELFFLHQMEVMQTCIKKLLILLEIISQSEYDKQVLCAQINNHVISNINAVFKIIIDTSIRN